MLKTDDNPDGVDKSVFDDMIQSLKQDRPAFLAGFGKKFVGWGLLDHPVSQEMLDYAWSIAVMAQPQATIDCVTAFGMTDFRDDVPQMTVPTLVVHGGVGRHRPARRRRQGGGRSCSRTAASRSSTARRTASR